MSPCWHQEFADSCDLPYQAVGASNESEWLRAKGSPHRVLAAGTGSVDFYLLLQIDLLLLQTHLDVIDIAIW